LQPQTGRGCRIVHPRPLRSERGHSIIDLLCVVSILCVLAAIGIPEMLESMRRPRAQAAARYLAARMVRSRTLATMRSAAVALRFQTDSGGFTVSEYVDGNRNGVRTADISSGADRLLEGASHLSDLFPRVTIAFSQDGATLDPVQIGSTTLMSFTPQGTATSGSIYVRGDDGSQYAIRVLGATARIKVVRYNTASRTWVDAL
jgi:Tfp pilus assembly protein FimT